MVKSDGSSEAQSLSRNQPKSKNSHKCNLEQTTDARTDLIHDQNALLISYLSRLGCKPVDYPILNYMASRCLKQQTRAF